jgi:carboxyl-terminal processing protease
MGRIILIVCAFCLLVVFSCRKKETRTNLTTEQKIKDTTLSYARDIYIWYKNIPSSLNAQNYADPNAIMQAIRPYSTEPGFSNPVDRWSFAMLQSEWNSVSSGVEQDFGMRVFFRSSNDLRVSAVDRNGAAGLAGVKRGWKISAINGTAINDTSQANFIVNSVYYSSSTSFTFLLPDNSTRTIGLNSARFVNNPFLTDSVYTYGAKRIGYFVLNSFLGDTNQVRADFDRVFNRFSSAGVNELVVDLRYNGGGYVMLAEYLLNYLVPAGANTQTLFTYQYNDKYTRFNSTSSAAKKGNLNLSRIFFIVSRQSASASELTINSIKPYLDVKLVGPQNTTGKPVGFFPIPVGNWYMFPVSFRTVNKNGEANFFNGFAPDHTVADGLDKDWGDVDEGCLSRAIRFITTGGWGRFAADEPDLLNQQLRVLQTNTFLDYPNFKGMVQKPVRLR